MKPMKLFLSDFIVSNKDLSGPAIKFWKWSSALAALWVDLDDALQFYILKRETKIYQGFPNGTMIYHLLYE